MDLFKSRPTYTPMFIKHKLHPKDPQGAFCAGSACGSAFFALAALGVGSLGGEGCGAAGAGGGGDFSLILVLGASGLAGLGSGAAFGAGDAAGDAEDAGVGAGVGAGDAAGVGAGGEAVAFGAGEAMVLGAVGEEAVSGALGVAALGAGDLGFALGVATFGVAAFGVAAFGVALGEATDATDTAAEGAGLETFGLTAAFAAPFAALGLALGDSGMAFALALGVAGSEAVSGTVEAAERREAEARGEAPEAAGGVKLGETTSGASATSSAAAAFSLTFWTFGFQKGLQDGHSKARNFSNFGNDSCRSNVDIALRLFERHNQTLESLERLNC